MPSNAAEIKCKANDNSAFVILSSCTHQREECAAKKKKKKYRERKRDEAETLFTVDKHDPKARLNIVFLFFIVRISVDRQGESNEKKRLEKANRRASEEVDDHHRSHSLTSIEIIREVFDRAVEQTHSKQNYLIFSFSLSLRLNPADRSTTQLLYNHFLFLFFSCCCCFYS